MFAANFHTIRYATADDQGRVRALAELDSKRTLDGTVLIAEIDGRAVAALSLDDGRAIADPFEPASAHAVPLLRLRARSIRALERTPSLSERIRAGVRVHGVWYAQ